MSASSPVASGSRQPLAESIPPRVGYLSRKALPIKRNDAEPLTREDVQYDLLDYLFTDKRAVFTDPFSNKRVKVTFGDLYINTVYNSNKCSKVLKERMADTPAFGIEFAKIALLTNVGRINTTMAFFPEMKTALRSYHPVPSLQKTDGNAQDAPRIKNCLKAVVTQSEAKGSPPATPEDIMVKQQTGLRPSTSIVNLVFVLANHAAPLAEEHFDGDFNFLDLFLPHTMYASADRGRAFLWLAYHYLEDCKGPNPFSDEISGSGPNKIPPMRMLTQAEFARENVDTREEIQWGNMMSNQRNIFLQKLVASAMEPEKIKPPPHFVTGNNLPRSQRNRRDATPPEDASFLFYVPPDAPPEEPLQPPAPRPQEHYAPVTGHEPPPQPSRSMFQQAWHINLNMDPLDDSSDEEPLDHHARLDYTRRLHVLSRILSSPAGPSSPL